MITWNFDYQTVYKTIETASCFARLPSGCLSAFNLQNRQKIDLSMTDVETSETK